MSRVKTEKFIIDSVRDIAGESNATLYKDLFKTMNDKAFNTYMTDIKNKTKKISVIMVPGSKTNISVKDMYSKLKSLGGTYHSKLLHTESDTEPRYTDNTSTLVLDIPVKVASQSLEKGFGAATNINNTDISTAQVAGKSKSVTFSNPEAHVLAAEGMTETLNELYGARGGDTGKRSAMNFYLTETGSVTRAQLEEHKETAQSNKSLEAYFNAMMLSTNVAD